MLGSLFALFTVSAAVLLVPAFAAVLALPRHRHVAPAQDSGRRVRLIAAATAVALAGLAVAALLGAGPVTAAVVAAVLAGSVLVWTPLTRSWAVRGVVMWSLLVASSVGLLGWLLEQMVARDLSGAGVLVTAGTTLVVLLVLWRGQGYVRDRISAETGLGPRGSGRQGISVVRPLVSLAVLLAAGGVVSAVTTEGSGPGPGRPPRAGASGPGVPPTSQQSSPAGAPTIYRSPPVAGVRATWVGGDLVATPSRTEATSFVPATPRGAGPLLSTAAPSRARVTSHGGDTPSAGVTRAGTGVHTATARLSGTDRRATGGPKPSDATSAGSEPEPVRPTSTAPASSAPPAGRPPATGGPSRTPGYAKAKPNRPADAPSPGHGRDRKKASPAPRLSPEATSTKAPAEP